nr:nucleotidyl transferase AbiEii/AbiGii toxin family protein [Coprococcus eutactus]
MITTARQLKDLIRNLSKKKSADAQILMRNYMMERFLKRISLSEYKDKFILKDGMLVAAMVGLDARATMDLDATIKDANVSLTDVETIISNIIARIAEIYEKEKDINRSLEWCRKAFRNSVNNKELQEGIEEKIEKLSKLA